MPCTSTRATYHLPDSEHALYKILSVTGLLLALFNLSLYLLLTHFRYHPSFHLSPRRPGRRGWLLLVLSLCFIGQACNDVYHAHMSPCFPAIRLWPEYMSARLAFQAPVGGIGALVQLERASSICLKHYKIRKWLWVAGLVLCVIITPMNVIFTAMDAEKHKNITEGYWAQYQGSDWLYLVNFVFPIVGVAATVWTTRVAFTSAKARTLKVTSGSTSIHESRASSEASLASLTAKKQPVVGTAGRTGSISKLQSHPNASQLLQSTGKCVSLRFLAQSGPSSPTAPTPSAAASPIQSSILLTFKFLSVMSIFSWLIGSFMVLGASQMSPAPRFCVAAMSGFPGLTVEILFKRLIRLRRSRRGKGDGVDRGGVGNLLSVPGRTIPEEGAGGKNLPLESHVAGARIGEVDGDEVRSGIDDNGVGPDGVHHVQSRYNVE